MKANTALCFLLTGIALGQAARKSGKVHADVSSLLLLSVAAIIALLSLTEYCFHRNLGIDEILVRDPASRALGQPPGRMSAATSFSFLCFGAGLFLVDSSIWSFLLCAAGIAISLVGLVGLLYTAEPLSPVRPFSTFSLPTAVSFLVLGVATMTLRIRQGVVPLVNSSYADIAMTRPLLAGAILLPPGFGWLCLQGQRMGWYPAEFTLGLVTVGLMLGSTLLLWWTGLIGWSVEQKRRHAETSLTARTEELTKSNAALEQYAFAAAHDLQEPLRMISLYSEALGRACREQFGAHEHDYLRILQSSARQMSRLVSDLLLHSRMLAEKEIAFASVDMNELLRDVITNYSALISDTGAQITIEELPPVCGNRSQLVHLFQNLLGNAIKYRKPGIPPLISIAVTSDGRSHTFTVADNGIGFEMQYAQQIFGVFKRLHGQEIPGTGIGLAICQRVVEKHNGRIWGESKPDVGSTFHVTLPAANAP